MSSKRRSSTEMDVEEEEEEYEVEKILRHKLTDGAYLYLVKWKGYDDPSDNTWEPKENLHNCPDKLKSYWKNQKLKKSAKTLSAKCPSSRGSSEKGSATKKKKKVIASSDTSDFDSDFNSSTDKKFASDKVEGFASTYSKMISGAMTPGFEKMAIENVSEKVAPLPYGWDKGHEAERILGATNEFDGIHYLVKWKGVVEADLLPSQECEEYIPDTVIEFLESIVQFK